MKFSFSRSWSTWIEIELNFFNFIQLCNGIIFELPHLSPWSKSVFSCQNFDVTSIFCYLCQMKRFRRRPATGQGQERLQERGPIRCTPAEGGQRWCQRGRPLRGRPQGRSQRGAQEKAPATQKDGFRGFIGRVSRNLVAPLQPTTYNLKQDIKNAYGHFMYRDTISGS